MNLRPKDGFTILVPHTSFNCSSARDTNRDLSGSSFGQGRARSVPRAEETTDRLDIDGIGTGGKIGEFELTIHVGLNAPASHVIERETSSRRR